MILKLKMKPECELARTDREDKGHKHGGSSAHLSALLYRLLFPPVNNMRNIQLLVLVVYDRDLL